MRTVLTFRQLNRALEPGLSKLRFVVAKRLPVDGDIALEEGQDVTELVRTGVIPEGALRSHVKRGFLVAVPEIETKALSALRRLVPGSTTKSAIRSALGAAGIAVPPAATISTLTKVREAATSVMRAAGP